MATQVVRLFGRVPFAEVARSQMSKIDGQIKAEDENYILNVNEEEYINHLVSQSEIEPLEVDFDQVYATDEEKLIAAEDFPPMSIVSRGRTYQKQVFTFHLPFRGALGLWEVMPTSSLLWNPAVTINREEKMLHFDVVQFTENADRINSAYDDFVSKLKQQLASLNQNVEQFNNVLRSSARGTFNNRKAELRKKAEVRTALRVPIRRNAAPLTFAVPVTSPKRIVPRPTASADNYLIDPTLETSLYKEILQLLHDFGKQLERLPGTYRGKGEETLRDHFLLVLQPHFGLEGSATGETFNAAGKTDILIRYQNQNLFVAEFKFWRGQKQHFETIDQLLSYLTWRDSKTAIVYFVDGKQMSPALSAIEETTRQHSAFVALKGRKEESWFSYELHLQDKEKIVQVAILCFHLPK